MGRFIWYEILTSDLEATTRFYSAVLGWKFSGPGQGELDYRHFGLGDQQIGGMMAIPSPAAAMGMKPTWLGYINVENVDAAIVRIQAAGGKVHMPPMDVPGAGRFAMVSDPQGASFYVMTPTGDGESRSFDPSTPGHCAWNELHTSDWKGALSFYGEQVGFTEAEAMDMGPMGTYLRFKTSNGEEGGGMFNDPQAPRPYWLFYFLVDDIDAAQVRLKDAGGEPLMDLHQVPGGGWILPARDPQGATFALVGPRKN